jgi:hypothetical protein
LGYCHPLWGLQALSFKARSDQACTISLRLEIPGQPVVQPAEVAIEASSRRKSYTVPLDELRAAGVGKAPESLIIHIPSGADVWLDNIAFVREPAGPRFGSIALMYEAGKLVHVAVPSLAALVVFVILLIVLRVEDAESIWAWLKQRVFGPIAAKLGRGKGQGTSDEGPVTRDQ